jgi:hypothetical protein
MIPDGTLAKYQSSPSVYLIQNQLRHWIPDPATLQSQWSWSQVKTFDQKDVDAVPMGDPIPSVLSGQKWPEGSLLSADSTAAVYVIMGGVRRWIPDPSTFNANPAWQWDNIESVPADLLNAIPLGPQLPSIIPVTPGHIVFWTDNTDLGSNDWMNTKVDLEIATGLIRAITHTWTGSWLSGFHGGVHVIAENSSGYPIRVAGGGAQIIQRFGVDGTADPFGVSDRTDAWLAQLDPTDSKNTVSLDVFQVRDPDTFQNILNAWVGALKPVSDLVASVTTAIGKVAGGGTKGS